MDLRSRAAMQRASMSIVHHRLRVAQGCLLIRRMGRRLIARLVMGLVLRFVGRGRRG